MKPIYNPLFESLYGQAKTRPITFEVYEEESPGAMKTEDVKKYFMEILNSLQLNVSSYILGYPLAESRAEMIKKYLDLFPKLENNSSLEDLVKALVGAWNDIAIAQVQKSSKKKVLEPVYGRVNAGIKELEGAFEELKKKAGDNINSKEIIDSINAEMQSLLGKLSSEILKKYQEYLNPEKK
jgi:hypothetical protein